ITGRTRHLFGPDAWSLAHTGEVTSGTSTSMSKGKLYIVRGEDKGWHNFNEAAIGMGGVSISTGGNLTKYYSSAATVLKSHFYGVSYGASISAALGLSLGSN